MTFIADSDRFSINATPAGWLQLQDAIAEARAAGYDVETNATGITLSASGAMLEKRYREVVSGAVAFSRRIREALGVEVAGPLIPAGDGPPAAVEREVSLPKTVAHAIPGGEVPPPAVG